MEMLYHVRCRECGYELAVSSRATCFGLLLQCDRCLRQRYVSLQSIRPIYEPFQAQVAAMTLAAGEELDLPALQRVEQQALALERRYERSVEAMCAPCICGGRYRFARDTPCPNCGSVRCY